MARKRVSVVIPCFKSANMISDVVAQSKEVIVQMGFDYEFILVNDASPDDTFDVISQICKEDEMVKGINLAKNFGQHAAIMAGLNVASGDFILGMDDDFQTHPSQIPKLFDCLGEEHDVVYAIYPERKHSFYRQLGSKFYQWTMRILTGRPKHVKTSSFWLARRFVCEQIVQYSAPHPHISALVFRATDRVGNILVEHHERVSGQSGYTMKKLMRLWATCFSFSIVPLRVVTTLGFILGFAGLIATLGIVVSKLLSPSTAMGWSSTMAVLLFATGVIVFSVGMVGEYVGRLFISENSFPQYVVRDNLNVEAPNMKGNQGDRRQYG